LKELDGRQRTSELERKEKGFMLYVNGANAQTVTGSDSKTARTAATRPRSCHKAATHADCKSSY